MAGNPTWTTVMGKAVTNVAIAKCHRPFILPSIDITTLSRLSSDSQLPSEMRCSLVPLIGHTGKDIVWQGSQVSRSLEEYSTVSLK